jgi:hypothetical protein
MTGHSHSTGHSRRSTESWAIVGCVRVLVWRNRQIRRIGVGVIARADVVCRAWARPHGCGSPRTHRTVSRAMPAIQMIRAERRAKPAREGCREKRYRIPPRAASPDRECHAELERRGHCWDRAAARVRCPSDPTPTSAAHSRELPVCRGRRRQLSPGAGTVLHGEDGFSADSLHVMRPAGCVRASRVLSSAARLS